MNRSLLLLLVGFMVSCSPDSPKLQPVPDQTYEKVSRDNDYVIHTPKVDIIFVIDDSASMGEHQRNLAANIGRFLSVFFNKISIDYHMGVLTTSLDWNSSPGCCGKLLNGYVDGHTVNPSAILASRMLVGTSGSGTEKLFDPVVAALSDPILSNENKGFYRQDAHVALIFITDAEDQSSIAPDTFHDFLVQLKGTNEKVLGYGAFIPTGSNMLGCPRDDRSTPLKIERFMGLVHNAGNNTFHLCSPDFGDNLARVATDLAKQVTSLILLNRPPIVSTIKVYYGTQLLPSHPTKGWSYDPKMNAIHLGEALELDESQPPGTKIRVDFEATTY